MFSHSIRGSMQSTRDRSEVLVESIRNERGIRDNIIVDMKQTDRASAAFVKNIIQVTPKLPQIVETL